MSANTGDEDIGRYGEARLEAIGVYKQLLQLLLDNIPEGSDELPPRWNLAIEFLQEQGDTLLDEKQELNTVASKTLTRLELGVEGALEDEQAELHGLLQQTVNDIAKLRPFFGDRSVFPAEVRGTANEILAAYLAKVEEGFGIAPAPLRRGTRVV